MRYGYCNTDIVIRLLLYGYCYTDIAIRILIYVYCYADIAIQILQNNVWCQNTTEMIMCEQLCLATDDHSHCDNARDADHYV